ncbi:MAG: hypothetical protein ACLQVJ_21995 [Syntrophobacteraceae bacterium]
MSARKKKKYEPDNPEQSARFMDLTERIELVENPKEVFEKAFKKVAKASHREKLAGKDTD